jgi:hypothetical protein
MSQSLTELSVDLASLFERADNEALIALRAGIVGELEPLRRFGVNMTIAALEAFAMEQGINTAYQAMDEATRTQLRFNFIMAKTTIAQGDAIRTADSFANSFKGLKAKAKEVATEIGMKLLPPMTWLARATTTLFSGFLELTKGTALIEAALVTLGIVAGVVATKILIAFAPVLLPLLKLAVIIALVALAIDDFLVFLRGGDSVLGRFIDFLFGPGSAHEAAKNLREAFQLLKIIWIQDIVPALKFLAKEFGKAFKMIFEAFRELKDLIMPGIKGFIETWKGFIDLISGDSSLEDWKNAVKLIISDVKGWFADLFESIKKWIVDLVPSFSDMGKSLMKTLGRAANFLGIDTKALAAPDPLAVGSGGVAGAPGIAGAPGPIVDRFPFEIVGPRVAFPGAANAGGNTVQNITQETNVTVQGNATQATANKIVEGAVSGTKDTHRKTLAALKQRKAS